MSKFCGNCGAQLDDSAKVCGNCGTPLSENSNVSSSIPGVEYVDPEKKAKNKKRIKKFIGLIAVVVVVIIAINIISGFIGYKGAVRKIMNAYEDYDVDTLVSLTSNIRLDVFDILGDDYATDYYENIVSDDLDYYENTVGHKYKLSYEITETYELTERKVDDLLDSAESYIEYIEDYDISKVMVVEVNVTAKEGNKSTDATLTIYLTKENGSWKLFQFDDGALTRY